MESLLLTPSCSTPCGWFGFADPPSSRFAAIANGSLRSFVERLRRALGPNGVLGLDRGSRTNLAGFYRAEHIGLLVRSIYRTSWVSDDSKRVPPMASLEKGATTRTAVRQTLRYDSYDPDIAPPFRFRNPDTRGLDDFVVDITLLCLVELWSLLIRLELFWMLGFCSRSKSFRGYSGVGRVISFVYGSCLSGRRKNLWAFWDIFAVHRSSGRYWGLDAIQVQRCGGPPIHSSYRLSGGGGRFAPIDTHGAFHPGVGPGVCSKQTSIGLSLDSCLEVWDSISCCTLAKHSDHHPASLSKLVMWARPLCPYVVKHLFWGWTPSDIHDKITLARKNFFSEHYWHGGFTGEISRRGTEFHLMRLYSSKKLSWDRWVKWLRGGDRDSKFFHSLRVRKSRFMSLRTDFSRLDGIIQLRGSRKTQFNRSAFGSGLDGQVPSNHVGKLPFKAKCGGRIRLLGRVNHLDRKFWGCRRSTFSLLFGIHKIFRRYLSRMVSCGSLADFLPGTPLPHSPPLCGRRAHVLRGTYRNESQPSLCRLDRLAGFLSYHFGGDLDHRVHSEICLEDFHSSSRSWPSRGRIPTDGVLIRRDSPWPQMRICGNDLETAFTSSTCPYRTAIRGVGSPNRLDASGSMVSMFESWLRLVSSTYGLRPFDLQCLSLGVAGPLLELLDYSGSGLKVNSDGAVAVGPADRGFTSRVSSKRFGGIIYGEVRLNLRRQLASHRRGGSPLQIKMGERLLYVSKDSGFSHLEGGNTVLDLLSKITVST
ncbi:hypothetical protein FNV43_RR14794 [Rhamnella rubrinervis]|uniref:Uncharacterized protein n=1 Tax=Rhamnella rubrinervis TaxID=2594499 RepID=A0A8K0MGK1_9ROSA|nr:hypothetical protein FNV43_RR14794 [Rhamnella rubrinervis]